MRRCLLVKVIAGLLLATGSASATLIHFEGFEDPSWVQGQPGNWKPFFSTATRVVSGTDGITSRSGGAHATLQSSLNGAGPVTDFGGWSSDFGAGFATSLDIYLDPLWDAGRAFTYRVGVNRQNGDQLRFFDWRFDAEGSELHINAAHTGDSGATGPSPEFVVSQVGWYTFENVFRNNGGSLLVDFNVYDDSDMLLYTASRGELTDDIASLVGGNRNGWLFNRTNNAVTGLAIDNTRLTGLDPIPEPATMTLLGIGLAGLTLRQRRKSKEGSSA
ncbi:MAG: PEP-CTERM sorting domain-containing protein [Candidatus Hydrogenedentes bacterium]|nr:PEP-CTERM sorting domain-containing protein [Candidatus Hydrogenedentota bacterium]